MTRPDRDQRLHELLSGAVDDIEPADRLAAITARTRAESKGHPMNKILAVGGAVVGTAAVITGIAWAGGAFDTADEPSPAATSTPTPSELTDSASPSPTDEAAPAEETFTLGLYFVGAGEGPPVLFREFQEVSGTDPVQAALLGISQGAPEDPDYTTLASGLSVAGASVGSDAITVELGEASRERPGDMSGEEAELALQQVVWTAQAAAQERLPLRFEVGGEPADQVYGVPTTEPVRAGDQLEVLSLVSLTEPSERQQVQGGSLAVEGRANSPEANVPWQVTRDGEVVDEGFFTAEGWMDRLYPFSGEIDVSGLDSGEHVLRVSTDDPSGGEGNPPHVDTRTFLVP